MIVFGLCLALWAWWRWRHPPAPQRMEAVWILRYTNRGKPMEFTVVANTEAEAVIKYWKAGLDPRKITASFAAQRFAAE